MNAQLHVVSDTTGVTGMKGIRAMVRLGPLTRVGTED